MFHEIRKLYDNQKTLRDTPKKVSNVSICNVDAWPILLKKCSTNLKSFKDLLNWEKLSSSTLFCAQSTDWYKSRLVRPALESDDEWYKFGKRSSDFRSLKYFVYSLIEANRFIGRRSRLWSFDANVSSQNCRKIFCAMNKSKCIPNIDKPQIE